MILQAGRIIDQTTFLPRVGCSCVVMTGHMTAGAAGTHLDQGEDDLQYMCVWEPVNGWRDVYNAEMYEISLWMNQNKS